MKSFDPHYPRTLVNLARFQLALAAPMSDVPNQAGLRVLGILKTNELAVPLTVEVHPITGNYLVDQFGAHCPTSLFSGWVRDVYVGGKSK
jgi:hypothetical protein